MLISARDAVRRLGVKPATLYAYVSRGLVRSTVSPGSKEHRYYADDIERLKRSKRKGRRTGAPPRAFDLYAPVLDSSLCLLEAGRIHYRGQDATVLAQHATLEEVAQCLWGFDPSAPALADWQLPGSFRTWLRELPPSSTPIQRVQMSLVWLASQDRAAVSTSLPVARRVARLLVPTLASAISGKMPTKFPIHQQLAKAWHLDSIGADLVRRCLVLVADHELNASTYVARCVASTRASPYAVVLAALCALSGPIHGGAADSVEEILREFVASDDLSARIVERLRLGERLLGFGHPLYPQGDPRSLAILDALKRSLPKQQTQIIFKIVSEVQSLSGQTPHIEFALAATSILLRLPRGSALGMFIVGRSVGWIAHAIEQYASDTQIRPRARYVGILPGEPQEPAADIG